MGCQAAASHADISDHAQIHHLINEVTAEFGAVDLLASNAGVEHHGALKTLTPEEFDYVFHTNVASQLFLTQAAVTAMPPNGRIVLTSSVSARVASYHHAMYASSKAAVSALVLSLAPELAEVGIAINAVAPGPTNTDMGREHAQTYIHPGMRDVPSAALIASMSALGRLRQGGRSARTVHDQPAAHP